MPTDDRALDAMSEVKAMVSELRRRHRDRGDEDQTTSIQEQANEVVRRKLKGG